MHTWILDSRLVLAPVFLAAALVLALVVPRAASSRRQSGRRNLSTLAPSSRVATDS